MSYYRRSQNNTMCVQNVIYSGETYKTDTGLNDSVDKRDNM